MSKWSLERSIGWVDWSWCRAAWRDGISGGFARRRAKTVVPVPPGTALHQLYSVPPTGRDMGSGACGLLLVVLDMVLKIRF